MKIRNNAIDLSKIAKDDENCGICPLFSCLFHYSFLKEALIESELPSHGSFDTMINYFVIKNDCTEADKRAYERKNVDFFWQVYDTESDVLVGDVADIGMKGFRLIGSVPTTIGKNSSFRMDISLESGKMDQIELDALCVWQSKKLNPGLCTAGYKFLELAPDTAHQIQTIIDQIIEGT